MFMVMHTKKAITSIVYNFMHANCCDSIVIYLKIA